MQIGGSKPCGGRGGGGSLRMLGGGGEGGMLDGAHLAGNILVGGNFATLGNPKAPTASRTPEHALPCVFLQFATFLKDDIFP